MVSNERMNDHLKCIDSNKIKSFDAGVDDSLELPFIAMKLFSLLTLQAFHGLNSYIDEEYWHFSDSSCFIRSVSFILASLMSTCEILNFRLDCNFTCSHSDLEECFNALSCGFLWLSTIISYGKLILEANATKINDILQSPLGRLANWVVRKVIPIALSCLKLIANTVKETRSTRSCFLLCLSLIRGSISYQLVSEDISKRNIVEEDNSTTETDVSMLGGLSDEMLMSINLDGLVGGSNYKEETDYVDYLVDFLLEALIQAKVGTIIYYFALIQVLYSSLSYRFNYFAMQPSANFKHDMNNQFSSCGKIVCFKNAGAICSTIASFCEVETKKNSRFQHVVAMISSNSLSAEMDSNFFRSDIIYMQQLRQYFGFEVTKLMNRKTSRIILNEYSVSFLLKTFIEALLDANALNIFATSNYKIMADVGGKKSEEREKKLAQRLMASVEETSRDEIDIDYDLEKRSLHRFKNQPGLFVAKYLWTFASNLGILLKTGSMDQIVEVGNAILDKEYGMEASVHELCEDVLGSLSLVSMERQCMKRFMVLRKVFCALINSDRENQQENLINDIFATTIKQMFQELDMIAKGTQCNNNDLDHKHSYNSAKLRALQNAYSHLLVTTASWLVRQISLKHKSLYRGYTQLLFDDLLFPSLQLGQSNQYLTRSNENIVRFDFAPQLFGPGNKNSSLSLDLFNATNRHVRELVIYAANIESKDDRSTKFYGLMRSTFRTTQPNTKIIVNLLPALVSNIEYENINGTSLSIAIDLYFSLVSMSASNLIQGEERLIQQFRTYAVQYFARNLSSKDNNKKMVMIDHLIEILDMASLRCKKKNESNFAIIIEDCVDKGYLHFKDNICHIVYGLSSCIEYSIYSPSESLLVMMKALVCLEHLLQIKIEGIEMLVWCQSKIHVNGHAKYVFMEMSFLYHLFQAVIYIEKSRHEKSKENSEQMPPIANFELLSKSRQLIRKEIQLQGQMSLLPTNNFGLEYIYKQKIDGSVIKSFDEFTKKYYYLSTLTTIM